MRRVLWLVGEPGIGKTTLARTLIGGPCELVTSPKWTTAPGVYAAGHYAGRTFDGADTISYSGGRAALEWWAAAPPRALTILDGDRLSHAGAVAFVAAQPRVRLACVYLTAPWHVGTARRTQRATNQDPTWLKGRMTKSVRFFANFPPAWKVELDARRDPLDLALQTLDAIS